MNEKELDKLAELEWLDEQGKLKILPCKIGDTMWGIRNWKGVKRPESAEVREMFFTEDMELVIVLRHLCRGIYGKQVFSSYEECEKALKRCYLGEGMKVIEREMESKETTTFLGQNALYCQASFNSDGYITLRNYDVNNKDSDEIIILSGEETHALIDLFKRLYKTFETQMPF